MSAVRGRVQERTDDGRQAEGEKKRRENEIAGVRTDEENQNVRVHVLKALRQTDPLWLFHPAIAVDGVPEFGSF